MASLSTNNIGKVGSASPSQNTTGSRRADGQPEGPSLEKAPAPVANGASRSELAAEEHLGVTSKQEAELTQRSVAGGSVEGPHTGH